MKKYLAPELTISSFDVEDIITASGQTVDNIENYAGDGWVSVVTGAGTTVQGTGAYFGWDAH